MKTILIRARLMLLSLDYNRLKARWAATIRDYRIDLWTATAAELLPIRDLELLMVKNRRETRALLAMLG